MSRALRKIIGGVLFIGAALFALSRAGTQTWLFQQWVKEWGPKGLEVGRVLFDGSKFVISDVVWRNDHLVLTVPNAQGTLRVTDSLRGPISLTELNAHGWALTFEDKIPAEQDIGPGGRVNWGNKLQHLRESLQKEFPFQIDDINLEGSVRLPRRKEGKEVPTAVVRIKGSRLGPNQDGRFEIRLIAKNPDIEDQLVDVDATTEVVLHMSKSCRMDRMITETRLSARGQRFPNGTRMSVRTSLDMTADDLAFGISASGMGDTDLRELLVIDAHTEPGTRIVTGSWRIDLNQSDLTPYTLGFRVPNFSAKGFGLLANTGGIRVAGELEATFEDLSQVDERLRPVGALNFRAVFDVIRHKGGYSVQRFSTKAFRDQPVAALQVLQPIELDEGFSTLAIANPEGDMFHLELENVPGKWIQPFVPTPLLTMGMVRGSFLANLEGAAVQVRSQRPAEIEGVGVEWKKLDWLDHVDLAADLQFTFSREGWTVDLTRMEGRTDHRIVFLGEAKMGRNRAPQEPLKVTLSMGVDIPSAKNQPFIRRTNLAKGHAVLKLDLAKRKGAWQCLTEATLEGASDGAGRVLPKLQTSMRVDRAIGGAIDLEMPLQVVEGDRRSSLVVLGSFQPTAERKRADIVVRSQDAHLTDLQLIVGALAKCDLSPSKEATMVSAPRPPRAVWGVVDANVRVTLNHIVLTGEADRASLDMLVRGTPDQLVIENLNVGLGEKGTAVGKGEINYSARSAVPYHFAALFQAKDFNPAPFLASLDPGRAPVIEGQFDIDASCKGSTADFTDLDEITSATISLTGRGGRFHAFDASAALADFPRLEQAPSRFAAWAALASNAKNDRRLQAATSIIRRLGDLNYDQATFELFHRPGEDTLVREFSLITPEIRLLGDGTIKHEDGGNWKDGRVHLNLELGARGKYGEDIRLLGLAGERADALGYFPLTKRLQVDGTLRDLGTETLVDLIGSSVPQ